MSARLAEERIQPSLPSTVPPPRAEHTARARWHRGAVIYQIYPRSFLDTNGDGVGDLAGITCSLRYIADLGVDAVWICPFFTSPMKDFGYDVSDYRGVDPIFGTLADFDRLITTAHDHGLKVIIDQVWSHSSDAHPWFTESRSTRINAKTDWYVWADPRPDGSPPNNWLSVFGGAAWSWEPRRRQYYLHHFLGSQPQLNLRHPEVVEALFEIGRFWLERGVDGFRLDAVDFMFHDPLLRDNPARSFPPGGLPLRPFGMQEHRHDMSHADAHGFFEDLRDMMSEYPGSVTLGEVSSEPGAFQRCADYTDSTRARLDMAYSLALMKRSLTPADFAQVLAEAEQASTNGCVCWAFSNHDVVRAATRWSSGGDISALSRMLVALLLTLPGTACLYQGEELGLPEAHVPPDRMVDPYGVALYPAFKGRDGSRTPMPWRADEHAAGFTSSEPWLPVDRRHFELAVDLQSSDPRSMLHFTQTFLRWRKASLTLVDGTSRTLALDPALFAVERCLADERILAIFNFSDRDKTLPRRNLPPVTALVGHGFEAVLDGERLRLPPYGAFFGRYR